MEKNVCSSVIITLCIAIYIFGCMTNGTEPEPNTTDLTGEYLGQQPPGMTPVRFPPARLLANSDWFWHGSPNFSPDLSEMYWGKYSTNLQPERIELAFVEVEDNQWSQMQTPPFADLNFDENNPCFSNSGDTLYFLSRRPEGRIFYVFRTPSGWSQPVQLDIPFPANKRMGWNFSITKNKSIYVALFDINGENPPDIYKTRYIGGLYTMPETVGLPVNTNYNEFWPYIDPDERFLIFISNSPGGFGMHDLYLSSRNQDGTWNDPVNLGPEINSNQEEGAPYISPDGLYFFFTTEKTGDLGFNPYWVDVGIIDDLNPNPR